MIVDLAAPEFTGCNTLKPGLLVWRADAS